PRTGGPRRTRGRRSPRLPGRGPHGGRSTSRGHRTSLSLVRRAPSGSATPSACRLRSRGRAPPDPNGPTRGRRRWPPHRRGARCPRRPRRRSGRVGSRSPSASAHRGQEGDLVPLPPDLRGDALEVRVERFGELLAGRLGPRNPEIPERLDPATAALLVMPEIQVWPSSDRFRRHATADLHGSDIRLTLLKVNARLPGGWPGWPHPSISTGNVHGGP